MDGRTVWIPPCACWVPAHKTPGTVSNGGCPIGTKQDNPELPGKRSLKRRCLNLFDWGHEERAQRINMLLTFAAKEESEGDSPYFQDQCLDMRLTDLQKDFMDVDLMLHRKELDISSM